MTETVLTSLNAALHKALAADEKVYLLGEDILDPYGGAFKVTRGCSQTFPQRVIAAPISEAGMVGVAGGMALRGLRPVVEIMFGDFLTLAADQIVNHVSKFRWMYNDQVHVPVVIRAPMGGRRGYGPTHSQTLEKHFLGVPGLRVLAASSIGDPGGLLFETILNTQDPVLFIENKLLYPIPVKTAEALYDYDLTVSDPPSDMYGEGVEAFSNAAAACKLSIRGAPAPALTIAAYGYMAEIALKAIYRLAFEYEVFAELIVLTQLAPLDVSLAAVSASQTGQLLVLEEGTFTLGWGAEVVARVAETTQAKPIHFRRLAAKEFPVPASPVLEEAYFPGEADIIQMALQMTGKLKV